MRCFIPACLFVLGLSSALTAQFLVDLRVQGQEITRDSRPRFLPILVAEHRVSVALENGVAKTKTHLVFRNPNAAVLEGTFMFPVPAEAALSNFALKMGDQMVQGEVLEKEKAAAIYRGIVARQLDPALLEYMGRGLFQAKVFPIPAQGTTSVELAYDEVLRRDGLTLEYRYPLRTRAATQAAVDRTIVSVELASTDPVLTIYSPSHEVDVSKKGDHAARIVYERTQDPADRDFVLAYGLSKNKIGATLFSHSESEKDGAFLLLIAPSEELTRDEVVEKDVAFVVDVSGSMAGEKIEQTKKALRYCINSLGPKDRFNLITFSTEARALFESLVNAGSDERKKALDHVDGLVARGGTNINDAVVQALGQAKSADRPYMVVFMTDGEPTIGVTATDQILANTKKANSGLTRLFVFGVGEQLKVDLLDQLAEQNQGVRDYVSSRENIEVKISSFFQKIASPVLTNPTISVEGVRTESLHPQRLGDVFRGSQLLLTGRFEGRGTGLVRLKGQVNGKPVEHVYEFPFGTAASASAAERERTAFVPRLWAVRRVGFLLDQIRLNGETKELRDEVVTLGKKYGVVTPYTSYLVVEDRLADTAGNGRPNSLPGLITGAPAGPPEGADTPSGGLRPAPTARGGGGAAAPASGAAPGTSPGGGAFGGRGRLPGSEEAKAGQSPAPTPAPVDALGESLRDKNKDVVGLGGGRSAELYRLRRDAGAPAQEELIESLKQDLDTQLDFELDDISVSKNLKALREASSDGKARTTLTVRRVENRTFYWRNGLLVESECLDLDEEALKVKVVRIEAFSPAYFELLQAKPDLAKVLALGDRVLFKDGDRFVLVHPPAKPVK